MIICYLLAFTAYEKATLDDDDLAKYHIKRSKWRMKFYNSTLYVWIMMLTTLVFICSLDCVSRSDKQIFYITMILALMINMEYIAKGIIKKVCCDASKTQKRRK